MAVTKQEIVHRLPTKARAEVARRREPGSHLVCRHARGAIQRPLDMTAARPRESLNDCCRRANIAGAGILSTTAHALGLEAMLAVIWADAPKSAAISP